MKLVVLGSIFLLGSLFPSISARLNLIPHGKEYAVFAHVRTGKFLSTNGTATDYYSARENYFEIFQLANGDKILLTYPFTNPPGDSPVYAMDVDGGCQLGSKISQYPYSGGKNQIWRFNFKYDTITSACNHNWALTLSHDGTQILREGTGDPYLHWEYFYSSKTQGL